MEHLFGDAQVLRLFSVKKVEDTARKSPEVCVVNSRRKPVKKSARNRAKTRVFRPLGQEKIALKVVQFHYHIAFLFNTKQSREKEEREERGGWSFR